MVTIFVYLFNIANMLGVIYTRHMGVIYKRIQKSEKLNKLNNKLIYTNTIQTKTLYPLSASVFPLTHKIIWHLTEWNNKVGHNAKVLTWYLITVRDFLQITRRGTCTYKVPLLKMSKFCLYFSGSCISLDLQLSAHVSKPVWKVCTACPRYRVCNFDAFYIFTIKFFKSRPRNFQAFQSECLVNPLSWIAL
jgi:hypothetical protein